MVSDWRFGPVSTQKLVRRAGRADSQGDSHHQGPIVRYGVLCTKSRTPDFLTILSNNNLISLDYIISHYSPHNFPYG